ncbi:MAG: aldo/keto reductase [Bryobacteraceae bacterium]
MQYRELPHSSLKVSILGFGASPLGNEFRPVDPVEAERAVRYAIDRGINFFDVSPYYGRTLAEDRLGSALEGLRQNVVLATKCGRYDTASFDYSAERTKRSAEESLRRLRTDYLDILHVHDIEFGDREQILNQTIPALKELKRQGKIRLAGITGLPLKMLADVAVRGEVDIVMSYCRYNLLIRDLDMYLTPVLKEHGIGLLNASPLDMGILTECGAPEWHPAPDRVKKAGQKIVELCRSKGINVASAALRFCLDHPDVSSTFVGMSKPEHVDTNLKAFELGTDPDFLASVERLAGPDLNVTWPSGRPENQD